MIGAPEQYLDIDPPIVAEVVMIAHDVAFFSEYVSNGVPDFRVIRGLWMPSRPRTDPSSGIYA